jgi:hypothetical protein
MNVQEDLLDVKSFGDVSGGMGYFFYYPDKIILFKHRQEKLEKVSSVDLNWERPYFPALDQTGVLSVFRLDPVIYLTASRNTSPFSKVFKYEDQQWIEYPPVDFVPFKILRINDQEYLSGASYQVGKNFFKNKIILAPFDHHSFQLGKKFEKKVPEFYSLAFSSDIGQLQSIHLVDTEYRYRFYSDNFEEQTQDLQKRGSALSSLSDEWLAVSDYSRGDDTIFFYKIQGGGRQLVYQNKIAGEIAFISAGRWKTFPGFWVMVKRSNQTGNEFVLQFWSQGKEPLAPPGEVSD